MSFKPLITGVFSLCGFMCAAAIAQTTPPAANPTETALDKDSDQTLDLAEVKAAAGAKFDKLDKDGDGTLDAKEVKGRIGPKTFKKFDPDNDGTLDKTEYMALVESLFKDADPDNDGTLNSAELHSKAGRTLKGLIR